jgi:hypothetical protein
MHPRRRATAVTQRLAALTVPVAITIGSMAGGPAVFAADSDIDRAFDTLGLPPAMEQVRSQVLAIVGDALDRNDADEDADDPPALRLENALRRWELMAPDWRSVPPSVMERVRLCRDARLRDPDAVAPEGCGEQLRLELRLRHMEQAEMRFQERLDAADGDATALGDLDRLQQRVMERSAEVEAAMDRDRERALDAVGLGEGDLDRIRDRLADHDLEMEREMDRIRAMGGQS